MLPSRFHPQIHVIAMNMHAYPRHPAMRTDRISSIKPLPSHDPLLDHASSVGDASNGHTSRAGPSPSPIDTAVTQIKRRRASDASDCSPTVKRARTKEDNPTTPFNSPNANNTSTNVIDEDDPEPMSLPRLTIRIPAPRTILSQPSLTAECANSEKKKLQTRVEPPVKKKTVTMTCSSSSKSRSELNSAENDAGFVCGLDGCTQRFRRKYDVNRHRKRSKRHGEKILCAMCPRKLSRPDSLRRHMQAKHGVVWSGMEEEEEGPVQTNVGHKHKTKKRRGRNVRRIMGADFVGSTEGELAQSAEREASGICLRQRPPEKMRIAFVMNPTEPVDDVDPTSDSDFIDGDD